MKIRTMRALQNILTSREESLRKGSLDPNFHLASVPILETFSHLKEAGSPSHEARLQHLNLPGGSTYDNLQWLYFLDGVPVAHLEVRPTLYYTHQINAGHILQGLKDSLATGRRIELDGDEEADDPVISSVTAGDHVVISQHPVADRK